MLRAVRMGLALLPLVSTAVVAQESDPDADRQERGNWAIGLPVSTLGAGAEVALRLHPNFVVRGIGTFGQAPWAVDSVTFGTSSGSTGTTFATKYSLDDFSVSAMRAVVDWHLFRDGGRLSAGFAYVSYEATGELRLDSAMNADNLRIGDGVYAVSAVRGMSYTIANASQFLPYVGFGYDTSFFKSYGFSISTDFGVLFGIDHDVSLKGGAISASDRDKEQTTIADKLPGLYPVISLSAKYRF